MTRVSTSKKAVPVFESESDAGKRLAQNIAPTFLRNCNEEPRAQVLAGFIPLLIFE